MNDLLSRPDHRPAAPAHLPPVKHSHVRLLGRFFSIFTSLIIVLGIGSGALLLLRDTPLSLLQHLAHAPVSAIPLLLIGLASLSFQVVTRPTPLDLFKACIVSTAFILWGIDQLLPTGWEATTLGDIVIVLYVIDLGWMMGDRLKQRHKSVQQATQPLPMQPAYRLHLLPLSPDARSPEPLPSSDVPLWQRDMSHPRLLKKVLKPGVQGSPCRGLGCPQKPFFSLFTRRLRRREGEKKFWGHPKPRQRAAALCTPACKTGLKSRTGSSKIRDDSYPEAPSSSSTLKRHRLVPLRGADR